MSRRGVRGEPPPPRGILFYAQRPQHGRMQRASVPKDTGPARGVFPGALRSNFAGIELPAHCGGRMRERIVIDPHDRVAGLDSQFLRIESHRFNHDRVRRGLRAGGRGGDL
jgi:hypothetical protein